MSSVRRPFDGVEHDLTHAPVLKSPDLNQPFELVTDACDFGIGAVLMQDKRPVAFESRKLIPAELNYTTTEKECLAVIHALKIWRCYLEGQPKERFTVVTDHNPLIHLPKQPTLSRRMARWSEYLQRFTIQWEYRPGRINVADPVSRRPNAQYPLLTLAALTRSLKATPNPSPPAPAALSDSSDVMDIDSPALHAHTESDQPALPAVGRAAEFKGDIIQGYIKDP